MAYTSDRRLFLAADGVTVVEEGDARAATLLVGEGGQLSDADARRYGLIADEAKAKASPPANKAKAGPAETK